MPRPKKALPNHGDRYEVKVTLGKDSKGSTIRKSVYSTKSKRDAELKAQKLRDDFIKGNLQMLDEQITFGEYAERWLEAVKRNHVRENTFNYTYKNTVKNHLIPAFGDCILSRIQKIDINLFLNENVNFSQSLIHDMRITLNQIFEDAVDNDVLSKNPCRHVKEPNSKQTPKLIIPYTEEQDKTVFNFAKTDPAGLSICILLKAGLRRGELLGLRWTDVDLEHNVIHISQALTETNGVVKIDEPKNKTSIRDVPIFPQLKDLLENAPRSVERYVRCKDNPNKRIHKVIQNEFVISNIYGNAMRPSCWQKNVYEKFTTRLKQAHPEIPILRAHGLRHTYGSRLYNNGHGKDIKTISLLMGHANVLITTKIYIKHDKDYIENSFKYDL